MIRRPPRSTQSRSSAASDVYKRQVLQQPGEEQVPGLKQRQVLLVLDLARGQQPRRLQVEQRRRHDKEVADLVQVPAARALPDIGDELVGDGGERHLGDVELVLGDQPEQQVKRALEDIEVYLEGARAVRRVISLARGGGACAMSVRVQARGVRWRRGRR